MARGTTGALSVRAKTQQVVDHHYDDAKPGKPLHLLVPGALIALVTLLLLYYIAYRVWLDQSLDSGFGIPVMAILVPVFAGGVFLFSYGYELYDLPRALRLTAIIVFISLAAVLIVAVLFALIGGSKGGRSSSSSSSSSGVDLGSMLGGGSSASSSSATGSSSGGFFDNIGPIIVASDASTHTVTHEVIREVPVAPPPPQPIKCPNCGTAYIPGEQKFVCPNCGAPTPVELIEESRPPPRGLPDAL